MIARESEFALVIALRKRIAGIGEGISAATAKDYVALVERMRAKSQLPEDARSRADFYRKRAALVYVTSQEIRQAFTARDRAERESPAWEAAMQRLQQAAAILDRYPPDPERIRHVGVNDAGLQWSDVRLDLELAGWKKSSKSKKTGLGALLKRPEWENALLTHVSPRHKLALAVSILTGARPAEIQNGVRIERHPDGIVITITGAKLSATRGQPSRTLLVSLDSEAARLLAEHAGENGATVSDNAKCLADAVAQAGRRAFPRMRLNVSPYSLRHAVASALKASGIDDEGVARVLGHRATRSQCTYGRACFGRRSHIIGVHAAAPIKCNRRDPNACRRRTPTPRLG